MRVPYILDLVIQPLVLMSNQDQRLDHHTPTLRNQLILYQFRICYVSEASKELTHFNKYAIAHEENTTLSAYL